MLPTGQTQKTETVNSIQVLRAAAVMLVVMSHAARELDWRLAGMNLQQSSYVDWFGSLGASGVDIFFVISGFIMVYISADDFENRQAWKGFIFKRLFRIFPVWWIYLLLYFLIVKIVPMAAGGFSAFFKLDWWYLLNSFWLFPAKNESGLSMAPLLESGWTLSYELFFYFIFSGLILFSRKKALRILFSLFLILSCGVFFMDADTSIRLRFLCNPILLEFVFGCFIADIYLSRKAVLSNKVLMLIVLAVFICYFFSRDLFFNDGIHDVRRVIYWGVPSALLVFCAVLAERNGLNIYPSFLVLVGNSSYSIYLSHEAVSLTGGLKLIKIFNMYHYFHPDLLVGLLMLLSIVIGIISYWLLEKNIFKLTRRCLFKISSAT